MNNSTDYREHRHNMCKVRNIIVKNNPNLLDRISYQVYPLLILSTGDKREVIYRYDDNAVGDDKHIFKYDYWTGKDKENAIEKIRKEINKIQWN